MKWRTFILSVVLLVIGNEGAVVVRSEEEANPVVHAPVGSIRGLRAEDGDYSMFMGIPYAQVDPDHPFGNSEPHPNFEGTFDAFDDSAICPQREEFNNTIVGSLDCLHVNVYVPDSASNDNPLAVFVWIFGGGFTLGFPGRFLYGPKFLVRHDIIFVTINYRLGPYGFMCLPIPEVPGNQGLKDQEIALKWVRDNIAAFGGDNSRITIGGNSAGGMSTDMHLYYGQEDNLYQKIIPQSGTILGEGIISNPIPTTPFQLADFFNYNTTDVRDALSFLATVNPLEVIAASLELQLTFAPCIEHEFEGVQRFISEHPLNIEVPRVKDIEVLIGFNNEEMYHIIAMLPDIVFENADFAEEYINLNFDFGEDDDVFAEMVQIVTHFYLGDQNITPELRQQVVDLTSDLFFIYPTLRTVKKYLDNGVQLMYLYMFSYSGGRNFSKNRLNMTGGGATHADELGYLFDISYMDNPLDPEDQVIVDRMTYLWANFIKYGNPTPESTELVPFIWQPINPEKWHYLELDTEVSVGSRPLHARAAFLDLFYKTNEKYQRGLPRPPPPPPPPPPETDPSSGRNIRLGLSLYLMLIIVYFV